jgi:uncharacterized protein (TIGR02679 family)
VSEVDHQPNVQKAQKAQKAVAFFSQAGLTRLMQQLREKYIEQGQVGGQVVLEESTPEERRNLSSFLGKPPYRDGPIRVKLMEIDSALQRSGFACTLPELLSAFFPETPLITRQEKRAARNAHQHNFRSQLQALCEAFPSSSRGRSWLEQGQHGLEWLYSRYKNAALTEQEQQLATIRYVAEALDRLPDPSRPQRLALFAQQTSGDPHMLDAHRATGRLFLLALHDMFNPPGSLPPQDRAQELHLYQEANLLVDTISSNVAVFNLAGATYLDGTPDVLASAAGARVLLLPLRQITAWGSAQPARADIYAVENPQVFEEVVTGMSAQTSSTQPLPTLVCTAGWPSMAALLLLDMLLNAAPANHLYYSGDFDLKGLQIAAHLLARYEGRCSLWQLNPASYALALQAEGVLAPESELAQLSSLPAAFAPLVAALQIQKKWAYQEGIAHMLINSLLQSKV